MVLAVLFCAEVRIRTHLNAGVRGTPARSRLDGIDTIIFIPYPGMKMQIESVLPSPSLDGLFLFADYLCNLTKFLRLFSAIPPLVDGCP